jgi:hypothetical protein
MGASEKNLNCTYKTVAKVRKLNKYRRSEWLRSRDSTHSQDLNSLTARCSDQIVEGVDFSVDEFKGVVANVALLTPRYILACYGSFIKLITIDAAAIVLMQFAIVLLGQCPSELSRSSIMNLGTKSNVNLSGHSRGDYEDCQ